ncbi:hypothetical protein HZH68_013802 [Vespula germanica]|uniref:Uncharacterized protein n=1 Tax=Vespula germanica TaxID=30212 RepID=A0A834JCF1_VESGE|nr:hypothetical protein HZH68_013802 [Vespula germanica]
MRVRVRVRVRVREKEKEREKVSEQVVAVAEQVGDMYAAHLDGPAGRRAGKESRLDTLESETMLKSSSASQHLCETSLEKVFE